MTQQRGGQGQENLAREGGQRSAQTPGSASNLAEHFRGMKFPATKADLVRHAQTTNLGSEVRQVVNNLPDQTYNSMADVMAAWGRERR